MKLDQKITTLFCLCLTTATVAMAGPSSFGLLAGHYHRDHRVTSLETDKADIKVRDWLTLDHEGQGYQFDTEMHFDFNGRCAVAGYAVMEPMGETPVTLTYYQPSREAKGRPCELHMHISPNEIRFDDRRYSCTSFCSMGGSLHGVTFKRATREALE